MNVNFSLPGLFNNFNLNKAFIALFQKNKHVFNDGFDINSVYGVFPSTKWGLERYCEDCSIKTLEEVISFYQENNISIHYEMTNPLIQEQHLNDEFCNLCLKIANKPNNAIIVSSEILKNYIKENYPNYKIITTYVDSDAELISYTHKSKDELDTIEDKNKYQLLLNNFCVDDCKMQDAHIKYLANEQLNDTDINPYFPCELRFDCGFEVIKQYKRFITREELIEKYIPLGFENFKIATNTMIKFLPLNCTINDLIKFYVYYLIKPEYQREILNKFITS